MRHLYKIFHNHIMKIPRSSENLNHSTIKKISMYLLRFQCNFAARCQSWTTQAHTMTLAQRKWPLPACIIIFRHVTITSPTEVRRDVSLCAMALCMRLLLVIMVALSRSRMGKHYLSYDKLLLISKLKILKSLNWMKQGFIYLCDCGKCHTILPNVAQLFARMRPSYRTEFWRNAPMVSFIYFMCQFFPYLSLLWFSVR